MIRIEPCFAFAGMVHALVDPDTGTFIAFIPGRDHEGWAQRIAHLIDSYGLVDVPDTPESIA